MLQDFTFKEAAYNWFYRFIESAKCLLAKGKSMKDENYFLIN
ncbi:MAG TPA: hypothetical protein VK772_04165 [Puia sp.]|jgi:hypothetical protein|nr:hypothetical protein [Puia sp.]